MKNYIYTPHFLDQFDPFIVVGEAIKPGSKVSVQKTNIDPAGLFVWIADEKGNIQAVMKSSLASLKQALSIK